MFFRLLDVQTGLFALSFPCARLETETLAGNHRPLKECRDTLYRSSVPVTARLSAVRSTLVSTRHSFQSNIPRTDRVNITSRSAA